MKRDPKNNITFFGSSQFSIYVLEELVERGYTPNLIVTTPDKPQGRKLILTPNLVKIWANKHGIKVYHPVRIDTDFVEHLKSEIKSNSVFVVASYGKILPLNLTELPQHKTLNIHPSLLPQYRGASPLQTTIINDTKNTGVTIIRIDEKMDHGPIVAQKEIIVDEWPTYEKFEERMARDGARLLVSILPDWVAGKIPEKIQNDEHASYTKKIIKSDGMINLSEDPYVNFRKIQAYHLWPQAYFLFNKNNMEIKVKITSATFSSGALTIQKVLPEGSKELSYIDFINGYKK